MGCFRRRGFLAAIGGLLALVAFVSLWPSVAKADVTRDLPAAARQAIEQGKAAVSQKDWTVAINYFDAARRAAPLAPSPLYYLGLAEAQIPGRELRAICWLEAYLALAPQDAKAAEVRGIIRNELEVKTNGNLSHVLDLLRDLKNQMDHVQIRKEETSAVNDLVRQQQRLQQALIQTSSQISPPSEVVARWEAKGWIDLVEQRMDISAFLDFERTLKAATDGNKPESGYPDFYHVITHAPFA